MKQAPIVIIGAGVAGLVAAIHAEKTGKSIHLIEATDRPGGRVKTDEIDGFRLDHGFQVLLTAYHEAQRYLDFSTLQLKKFNNGALIFQGDKSYQIGDPLRDPSQLLNMAFSSVGTLKDKWLIFKLTQSLKKQDRSKVFKAQDQTTLAYLQDYGFSEQMINRFFRPFFGGIFLENDLNTSASMFRFVFKLFSEGSAAIPNLGIEAIVDQLKAQLSNTTFHFNQKVDKIEGKSLQLQDGTSMDFDKVIIACPPGDILPNLQGSELAWTSTCNLYFTTEKSILNSKSIALVTDPNSPINNFCVLTDVSDAYTSSGKSLVSVTLKKYPKTSMDLSFYQSIAKELASLTNYPGDITFLKRYDIPQALPVIDDLEYSLPNTQFTLTDDIYLAGDYLLNASLDAAMRTGRLAAEAMMDSL
ncbi:MAG: NAD(P)/FAD-dependent oxidoreductase [Saprospiraceae bacterium]